MEIKVNIEAPGLMEALLAVAEELKIHNVNSQFIPGTPNLTATAINTPVDISPALDPNGQISTGYFQSPPSQIEQAPNQVVESTQVPQQAPQQALNQVVQSFQTPQQAPQQATIPTTAAPSYTQQDMAMACVQVMESKGQAKIMEIMGKFGVQALTQLDKARYNDLAQALRAEGANI